MYNMNWCDLYRNWYELMWLVNELIWLVNKLIWIDMTCIWYIYIWILWWFMAVRSLLQQRNIRDINLFPIAQVFHRLLYLTVAQLAILCLRGNDIGLPEWGRKRSLLCGCVFNLVMCYLLFLSLSHNVEMAVEMAGKVKHCLFYAAICCLAYTLPIAHLGR